MNDGHELLRQKYGTVTTAQPSPFKEVSDGWTLNPPESTTCGVNKQLIVDLECSSDGNIDGLELDGSVEESPPQSMRRNSKRVKLEFNGVVGMEIGE